jgi:hypothetical protein
MRTPLYGWVLCVVVARAGSALAAPAPTAKPSTTKPATAHDKFTQARVLFDNGDYEKALGIIAEGLAMAPKDTALLLLKCQVQVTLSDYTGALSTCEADLAAHATGANQRNAQQIIKSLGAVKTTFLEVTVANGPATIYHRGRSEGAFCTAAPSCNKPIMPDVYKVTAERPGFQVWTGRVSVSASTTAKLAITLVEKPSLLTVRVAQPGAKVTVDGTASDAPVSVAAGPHQVVVSLAGHQDERREVSAREGKPIDLELRLTPLVAVKLEPATATLLLDRKPAQLEAGGMAIPPGEHELVVRAPGYRDRSLKIPAARAADYAIAVELARVETAAAPSGLFTSRRKVALVAGGAGVVAAAAGLVLGVQSKQRKDDAFALCPSSSSPCSRAAEADTAFEAGRSRALQADVAFGIAGGAAIAAAVLWFTGAPESPRVAITPRVGAVAGLDLAVTF